MIILSRRKPSVEFELAVLNVLAPGGQLTFSQLLREAELGGWATRIAISYLDSRGLIVPSHDHKRWRITRTGHAMLARHVTEGGRA